MANYSATNSVHKTLTANTVDVVTFTGGAPDDVEVLNRGSDAIYFTVNGGSPAVAGDDTFVAVAGGGLVVPGGEKVRLISASATAYSVSRVVS